MNNQNNLPDFIVIGAMKCGTTSFRHHLKHHPEIFIPEDIKNIEFFDANANWKKGLSFYRSHFTSNENFKSIGEISTEYTKFPHVKDVPKNIYSTMPHVKLIYLIRHPIERLISHYLHNIGAAREDRDINEALLQRDNNPYIIYSQYFFQITQFLEYFNKERLLVITTEQLRNHRQETLNKVFDFIDVDSSMNDWPEVTLHTRESKKEWNSLGKLVRKRPRYFNPYNYYVSKLPASVRPVVERLFCQPIKQPVINQSNMEHLSEVFANDLYLLQQHIGIRIPDWTFTTRTIKPYA